MIRTEKTNEGMDIIIDGWEKGIQASPYQGIANIRNLNTSYYPGVAYVNYRRQACSLADTGQVFWFAGTHSVNVSNNQGWMFTASDVMTNPVQHATSPLGLNYILDDSGQIWKQSAVNSSTFNLLGNGAGRYVYGNGGLAYWNNYLVVIGAGYIEFCGDGTGDAGIVSTNWNKNTYSTAVVSAGALQLGLTSPFDVSTYSFTGAVAGGATSATLSENWAEASGNFTIRFSNTDERVCTLTNGLTSCTWSGGLTAGGAGAVISMYQFKFSSSTGFAIFNAGDPVQFTSTGSLPTGITAGTTYYLTANVTPTTSILGSIGLSATNGGLRFFPMSDAGSGVITMTNYQTPYPIKNQASINFSWGSYAGNSTSATLSTPWLMSSGQYQIVDPTGNSFYGTFAHDSTAVSFIGFTVLQPTGNYSVNILNTTTANYRAHVSKSDGNLYFCNGNVIGRIYYNPATNAIFNPGIPVTYLVKYAAIASTQQTDTIVDMDDLNGQLVFAGIYDLYVWDFLSVQPTTTRVVSEKIVRVMNILNNLYVFAGTKGNIYVSNGYSAQLLQKIPDYLAGVFDPIWSYGGSMFHRSKLWFQATAQTSSGTNIFAGIFSLLVSPGLLGEQASGLVMENQNSYGLIPVSGAKSNGILIDNEAWSTGIDSYYSAWSNGASIGGIDYNDNTLWQNYEPFIETDIIPIGNYLVKKTLGSIEVKLDRPLVTGDSISLYWRPSLTDSYVQIPFIDTSSGLLSNYGITAINQAQWAQFMVKFACSSTNSSRMPLREIRIHVNS